MSVSGIGPAGMDPMGESQSSQSISIKGIVTNATNEASRLSDLLGSSDVNASELSFTTAALIGTTIVLKSIFIEAGYSGSDVQDFQQAVSNFTSEKSSSNCAALVTSLSNLSKKIESTPIKITPQQSINVIQRSIGMASDSVELAADEAGKSTPNEGGVILNLKVAKATLSNLAQFCPAVNLRPDISSSLLNEVDRFATYMEPGQDTQANISHFSSLFNEWATSFFNDVKNQLG